MDLQERIENYWSQSAENFSEGIRKELQGSAKNAWLELIQSNAALGVSLKVLDIGTGPGFFAILLSLLGHRVTAIDCTESMLEEARNNAEKAGFQAEFARMDCHRLAYADKSFDLIICRNLVWTLRDPEEAYREWYRVLKSFGKLLIFDANWYLRLFDAEIRREYEEDRKRARDMGIEDPHDKADLDESDPIARQLFLSDKRRSQWDVPALINCGFKKIFVDVDISDQVWTPEKKILYRSTPMFMVGAEKA
ncbi:class I SAM-dependent methyltransferase [Candidatus Formimonas warabiya]|uniref:Methyltransferase type 11 n=1 Tax=Formimonas warabiya TaxID=1761012 RepID=A0A3G1KYP5_FORW1|nr:class I SAM-dependent methyltransferase [Candidatus Formimonas warabiya]ATW27633.1 methyltransferase type 11 [Candidatus Formimonas warabiya]